MLVGEETRSGCHNKASDTGKVFSNVIKIDEAPDDTDVDNEADETHAQKSRRLTEGAAGYVGVC